MKVYVFPDLDCLKFVYTLNAALDLHLYLVNPFIPMLQNILLADSGNGQAEQMLDKLLDIPLFSRSSITVLHVIPEKSNAAEMDASREEGAQRLAKTVATLHLDDREIASVNTLLKEGDPKLTVCKVADELNIDLIIMGSRGLKRLQSIFENSVSQYVFQLSARPMLLVKDDIFIKRIKRVMVAVDATAASQESLRLATRMLRDIKGSKIQLMHVSKDFKTRAKLSEADAQKLPILADAIKLVKREGVDFQCFTGVGKPGAAICKMAEEFNTDLIVIGSPDRRPSIAKNLVDIDRLLGSSVSDSVRIQADCPVLFVRQTE